MEAYGYISKIHSYIPLEKNHSGVMKKYALCWTQIKADNLSISFLPFTNFLPWSLKGINQKYRFQVKNDVVFESFNFDFVYNLFLTSI